jgi:hypothetical protein
LTRAGGIRTHIARSSIERLNGYIERRYEGLPNKFGGPFVAPLMIYPRQPGYTGLFLMTLRLGLDPWWLPLESVRDPSGKP